jgi:hypothetical protein
MWGSGFFPRLECPGRIIAELEQEASRVLRNLPTGVPLTPTDVRNKFCYDEWQRGQTHKEIQTSVKLHPEWEQLSTAAAVRGPIAAWAKKNKLPVRRGQPGKPKVLQPSK